MALLPDIPYSAKGYVKLAEDADSWNRQETLPVRRRTFSPLLQDPDQTLLAILMDVIGQRLETMHLETQGVIADLYGLRPELFGGCLTTTGASLANKISMRKVSEIRTHVYRRLSHPVIRAELAAISRHIW